MPGQYSIKDIVRITGNENGVRGDLIELATQSTVDPATGMQWPITVGQGLIDNCWLIWHSICTDAELANAEKVSLKYALAESNNRPPIDVREHLNIEGYLVRLSMRQSVNLIWKNLPIGSLKSDDPRKILAYTIRQKFGQYLRNTLNAICVVRSGRENPSTWWIRSEWNPDPPYKSGEFNSNEHLPAVPSPEPSTQPRVVTSDDGNGLLCGVKDCTNRGPFKGKRALAIHHGHMHPDEPFAPVSNAKVVSVAPVAPVASSVPLPTPMDELPADYRKMVKDLVDLIKENHQLKTDNARLRNDIDQLSRSMPTGHDPAKDNSEITRLRTRVHDLETKLNKTNRVISVMNNLSEKD